MHRISRAPVLSATLSLDSCWIIYGTRLLPGLLENFDQAPALRARQRPALHHPHHVALVRLIGLVVRVEGVGLPQHLLVETVTADVLEPDGDRLLALAGDDDALADLAGPRFTAWSRLLRGRAALAGSVLRALLLPPSAALTGLAAALLRALGEPLLDRARRTRLAVEL